MRILLWGILGAAASTAGWLALEVYLHQNLSWLACAVGLVTGLCVYFAAGKKPQGSAVRGAIAAILTVLAMTLGHQVVEMIKQQANEEKIAQANPPEKPPKEVNEKDTHKPPKAATNESTKPETKPKAKPDSKPKPETKPDPKPEVKPKPKPEVKPKPNPPKKPAPEVAKQPVEKPEPKGAAKTAQKPAEKSEKNNLAADLKRDLGSWEMLWLGLSTLIAYAVGRGRDRATE